MKHETMNESDLLEKNDQLHCIQREKYLYNHLYLVEIRSTKKVSMFPVGLGSHWGLSSPVVRNGTVIDFYDYFHGNRKFRIDMAGFAVNVKFLLGRPNATMRMYEGNEEESFLQSLTPFEPEAAEVKASNCTKILVWHTKSKKIPPAKQLDRVKYNNTNLIELKKILVEKEVPKEGP